MFATCVPAIEADWLPVCTPYSLSDPLMNGPIPTPRLIRASKPSVRFANSQPRSMMPALAVPGIVPSSVGRFDRDR